MELVRNDEDETDDEESAERTGEEVEDGLGAAEEWRAGVTVAEGAREGEEEDLVKDEEMGDLGAEEDELLLEDDVLLSR